MSRLVLLVLPDAYELQLDGQPLARLEGGSRSLLAGAGDRLKEYDIEAAIERAEDWLMPSSKSFQGLELQVRDVSGRVYGGLGERSVSAAGMEEAFTGVHAAVAHDRSISPEWVADAVLLRELAHHAKISRIVLIPATGELP